MNTEDKENQSFEAGESTVQTPLKWTATSSSVLEEMQPAVSGRLTTPPKPSEVSSRDPWTPTANLKMLISAASPEIRNREQEKKLSNCRSESFEEHLSGDEYEKSQPSRKDKSLGLLCHKFLARYPCYPNPSQNNEICLDEVSEELNVERRRIYDIMNVLESLHMVSRLAKNKYSWHGCYNLKRTLQILKKVAEENKYTDQIELIKKRESEQEKDGQKTELVTKHIMPNDHTDICFVEFPGMEFRTAKIRRLYDIANVLSSLELIKKVHISEDKSRKPAFKWTGPDIFSDTQGTQPVPTTAMIISSHPEKGKSSKENCSKNLFPTRSKQGFTRHPSLIKTAKTMQIDQRKIRSAPSSPIKKNTSQIASSLPSKMAQLAAICKQQLDEQSRDLKKMEMKLEHYTLPGCLGPPPGSCLKPKPSQDEILPLIPSSGSPAMLTHVHSNVPYVLYFPPSQTQIVTAHSRGFSVQPFPCTNVMAMNSVETSSQLIPEKKCIEDSDINLAAGDASSKEQSFGLAKEQEGRRDDLISGKCFKMCESVLEDTPIKKCKNEELEHQDGLQTCLPSGYLIPFPQFTKLLNETTVSSSKKTEQEQKTYGSPIADGIPVQSNATKINFPTLQFTPLNLMVPSSVATVSVANGPAVTLSHAAPVQAPNPSLLNFMLQHVGLMPANVQASVNQVFGSALVCQQAEHVNAVPRSVSMKKRKALQNVLPKESSGFSGKTVPTTPLKTTTVSAVPNDSYKGNGSVFQMSCEPSLIPGFCSSSCEPDKISQEELVVQQRELDMSIEDDDV
ncbi:transcription factor E2F8 isoform X2 [Anolis carolinensis]|uniref:transcription factor E2F8 isoform X2 n=1 Tax=Anolis carolinensis TaxID=28377 RepID=UPI002F2B5430